VWWLPASLQARLGGAPGRPWDALTLVLPLAAAAAPPPGLLSLVPAAALPALRRRGDCAALVKDKDAALRGLVPALPAPLAAFGDHGALYAALLRGAPGLEAALQPGSSTLACLEGLHYTDSATLAGLRTCKLSEHCLVVSLRCPEAGAGASAWEDAVAAWVALALACGDALAGLKTSSHAAVEGARAAHKREEARRALEAKAAKERQEALARLPPGEEQWSAAPGRAPPHALRSRCTHAHAHAQHTHNTRRAAAEQMARLREDQLKAMKKRAKVKH
jgi:hypothetical protein